MIYMDNAATTMQKPPQVAEAVVRAMGTLGNAGRGASEASLGAARVIYETREQLCRLFHGEDPRQIVFTSNATESLNTVIGGLIDPEDHVITTAMEHNSVLRPLYACERMGTELTILGCDEKGNISYEKLEAAIRENTKAIICTHGSNLTGNLNDAKKIGAIAKRHGVLFVLDASQTAGHVPIDVQEMQIDVLCFTGHKGLLGPQGTGGMYVRPGVQIRPLKRGGSGIDTYNKNHPPQMPTALEAGTLNGHGIAGLNVALYYICLLYTSRFRSLYPMEQFRILESDSARVVEKVAARRADIGLTGTDAAGKYCEFVPFYEDELIVITPNSVKYQNRKQSGSALEWIAGEPIWR